MNDDEITLTTIGELRELARLRIKYKCLSVGRENFLKFIDNLDQLDEMLCSNYVRDMAHLMLGECKE